MILEFREPIEVDTPLGRGQAFFLHITAHDNHWTVALNDSKAFVTFHQDKVRATNSYSAGRGISDGRMRSIVAPLQTAGPSPRQKHRKRKSHE